MDPGRRGGHLLFSDLIANVIYKWTPDGQLSAFLENIYDGPDLLNVGQQTRRGRMNVIIIGANGLTLDREGRLDHRLAGEPGRLPAREGRHAHGSLPTASRASDSTARTTSS